MPSWLSWLWDFIKDPDNRTVLSWLGGGVVVIVGGAWTTFKFLAERKKADDKKAGGTNVNVGQGFAIRRSKRR